MRNGPRPNPFMAFLKYLGAFIICAYMSFPLLPFQGRFWKGTEIALCALFLMLAVTSSKSKPLFQFRDWPCWIFLLGLAAGLVAPVDRVVANQRYRELFVTVLSLYYIGKALARSEPDRLVLITLLCLLSSAATLYEFWYYVHHLDSSLFTREIPNGMYEKFREEYVKNFHPTILGNYLALSPCFALSLLARGSPIDISLRTHKRPRPWLWYFILKALGFVTLALGSLVLLIPYWRAAPYVFILTVCCFFLLKRSALVPSVIVSLFAIVLFIGSLSPTPVHRQDIRNVLVGWGGVSVPHHMTRMWVSWSMWRESPLVGVGFEHYWTLFDKHRILHARSNHPNRARLTGADFEHYWRLNRPHPERSRRTDDLAVADNMYCTLLAETGLAGVMGFFLLVFALLRRGFNGLRPRHRAPDASLCEAKRWGPLGLSAASGWAGCRPTRGVIFGAAGATSGAPHAADSDRRTCLITAMAVLVGLLVSMVGYDLFYWRTPFMLFSLVCGLISALSVTSIEGLPLRYAIP